MPYDPNIIWAGTDIGIYQSTDGGGSWMFADNGFPATAVYEMVIVNDEIVVATHGRGIWSVNVPELSGYEPPAVTKSPRLSPIAQNPSGTLVIPFTLRSPYDSTWVMVNQKINAKLPSNSSVKDTSILYPVMTSRKDSIQIISLQRMELLINLIIVYPMIKCSHNLVNLMPIISIYLLMILKEMDLL